ncbi:hypothetical protein L0Y65_02875 [Candidatus Micrarchaeota archaeon]|nr:hypothetical protein [Candidatus Micrarchaeota archaeon]
MAIPSRFGRRNIGNAGAFGSRNAGHAAGNRLPASSNSMLNAQMSRGQALRVMGLGAAGIVAAGLGLGRTTRAVTPGEYPVPCGVPAVYTLTAGQNIPVGTVTVANDGTNLYVLYEITVNDWCMTETHMHIAHNQEEIPHNYNPKTGSWIPVPGQFRYSSSHEPCVKSYLYTIPLSEYVGGCNENLIIVAHAAVKYTDPSCTQTGVVYGIQRYTGKVFQVDVLSGTSSLVFTIGTPPGANSASPNGLAYDPMTQRFYYTDYQLGTNPDTLYYWNALTGQVPVGQIAGTVACADFYGGKYYYIASTTDDLYEVSFNPAFSVQKMGDISGNAYGYTFDGDIAISPDGVVYGWGKTGSAYHFFRVNRDGTGFQLIRTNATFSLQIAFGSDGKLYGHDARVGLGGRFYLVDTNTGGLTMVPSAPSPPNEYTDIASGQICVPVVTTETAFGGDTPGPGPRWWFYANYTVQCCQTQCLQYQTETAFGGNNSGPGAPPWWFFFNAALPGPQTIWAGQSYNIGTVEIVGGVATFNLIDGWELQGVSENVKIQGYFELPPNRPEAGSFDNKSTWPAGTKTFQVPLGEQLYPFYVFHLDVRKCVLY